MQRLGWVSVVVVATSGCLGSPSDDGASDDTALTPPVLAEGLRLLDEALINGHDHSDPTLHPRVEWNIHEVFSTYVPMTGAPPGAPSEFSIHDHYAFVATFPPSTGFVILDLSDPEAPTQVGYYNAGSAYTNDVEVSADGHWAFVPTQPFYDPQEGLGEGLVRVGDYGVQIVDVSDLAAPVVAGVYISGDPSGYHRLDLEEIGGSLYVFGAAYGLGRVDILRFDETPVPRLVPVAIYQSPEAQDPRQTYGLGSGPDSYSVHDVTVDPDPLDGFPLLAVAHWRAGVHFVDVSDPADPRFLGKWDGFVDVLPGNVHNVEFTAIEGRRIAVAQPEYPGGHERQGILWIIDATDFAAPVLHGTWSVPGDHPVEGGTYVYTTDRTTIRNGTLFVSHFHAGAIVLDVRTLAKAAAPEMLGFIIPEAADPLAIYMGITTNPLVYDAIPYGEDLLYTDLTGKFHVARLGPEVLQGRSW